MTEALNDTLLEHAVSLLQHYYFDTASVETEALVRHWASQYQARWVKSAVIEALYQGRYKAVSVEQILMFWQRRGQPVCHFSHEFERIVCESFCQFSTPLPEGAEKPPLPVISGTSETMAEVASGLSTSDHSPQLGSVADQDGASSTADAASNSPSNTADSGPAASSQDVPLSPELAADASALDGVLERAAPSRSPSLHSNPAPKRGAPHGRRSWPNIWAPVGSAAIDAKETSPAEQPNQDLFHNSAHHPIHQFVPQEEPSDFYSKLKAVAEEGLDES